MLTLFRLLGIVALHLLLVQEVGANPKHSLNMNEATGILYRNGNQVKLTPLQVFRFWSKVEKTTSEECWNWTAYKDKDGYGCYSVQFLNFRPHRVSWELANGEIPEGIEVCHSCDNPACVNPSHLFLGTRKQNEKDKHDKGRHVHGETVTQHVLTEDQVREIRRVYATGQAGCPRLGKQYGVTTAAIQAIVTRKTWRHIPDEDGQFEANRNGKINTSQGMKGSEHHKAKVTEEDVLAMRKIYDAGLLSTVKLAKQYNISQATAHRIVSRQSWTHLT